MKQLLICRGLPGSGKSTKALELVNGIEDQVCENDNYYIINKTEKVEKLGANSQGLFKYIDTKKTIGDYKYNSEHKENAGWWCFYEVFRKFQVYDTIAVANVFASKTQIIGYIKEAKKFNIKVKIINMPKISIEESYKNNIHNCSLESIKKMYDNFEEFTQEDCDKIYETT